MRTLKLATTQMACTWDIEANINRAEQLVRDAAAQGSQLVLLQELFETPYFCIEQNHAHLELASTIDESAVVRRMQALSKELAVVLPVSFFERSGPCFFNTVAMIDADGTIMGIYRKTHIPNDTGYQEKSYFSPGDTGFKVWNTRYGKVGVGICWDQWFPETARCMALAGAEVLLYPTAIGSEPEQYGGEFDSSSHWQNAMRGHAAANIMPVIASNRIGREVASQNADYGIDFYGSSFIADHTGELIAVAGRTDECVLVHEFDLDAIAHHREVWGVYRDRRPHHYGALMTLDGRAGPVSMPG